MHGLWPNFAATDTANGLGPLRSGTRGCACSARTQTRNFLFRLARLTFWMELLLGTHVKAFLRYARHTGFRTGGFPSLARRRQAEAARVERRSNAGAFLSSGVAPQSWGRVCRHCRVNRAQCPENAEVEGEVEGEVAGEMWKLQIEVVDEDEDEDEDAGDDAGEGEGEEGEGEGEEGRGKGGRHRRRSSSSSPRARGPSGSPGRPPTAPTHSTAAA